MSCERTALLWFKFSVGRKVWRVYLTTPEVTPALRADLWGLCVYTRPRRIFINAMGTEAEQACTLVHEMLHAHLEDAPVDVAFEEEAITAIDEQAWRVATVLGARLPPRPKGWASTLGVKP